MSRPGRTAPSPGRQDATKSSIETGYNWFILRTMPHQERKVKDSLIERQPEMKNILEVYCPTRSTLRAMRAGREVEAPLFSGMVFVFATAQVLKEFISSYYPEGRILYERRSLHGTARPRLQTIPEEQMRAFMDFNENYADQVVVLERPYTDYAFNPKTNEANDVIRVLDGPLAGHCGYLTRFRRDRRLVFNLAGFDGRHNLAVSIPEIWKYRCIRLHNSRNDRQSTATAKARATDLLLGLIQGCGYGTRTLDVFHDLLHKLVAIPSLVALCQSIAATDSNLARAIAHLSADEARLVMNLVRYETDFPGYAATAWPRLVLRPFLTPTCGPGIGPQDDHALLRHPGFTEIIRRTEFDEPTFFPQTGEARTVSAAYYAHLGLKDNGDGTSTLFANWDALLSEYFLTDGTARSRLLQAATPCEESFARYAPTLHAVLAGRSEVRALEAFDTGAGPLGVLALSVGSSGNPQDTAIGEAASRLISTGTAICREINASTHLAVWRRYLRGVWLHR